jgi:hypothetical protein
MFLGVLQTYESDWWFYELSDEYKKFKHISNVLEDWNNITLYQTEILIKNTDKLLQNCYRI